MIIALNHKSNMEKDDFIKYIEELKEIKIKDNKIILCPSYLNIPTYDLNKTKMIKLGAQNVSKDINGAHTGEISSSQLKSYNVEYCIIGHSERRNIESYEDIHNKIERLNEEKIIPILCVGETKEQKDNNQTLKIINEEIESAIINLNENQKEKIIIAYEPVWAIGTGIIPTIDEIDKVITKIKELLPKNKVLYGGSVGLNNIEKLLESNQIDGYLLGSISLDSKKIKELIKIID